MCGTFDTPTQNHHSALSGTSMHYMWAFDTPTLNHHSALSGTSMHYVWDLWYSYTEPSQCLV